MSNYTDIIEQVPTIVQTTVVSVMAEHLAKNKEFEKDVNECINQGADILEKIPLSKNAIEQKEFLVSALDSTNNILLLLRKHSTDKESKRIEPEDRLAEFNKMIDEWVNLYPASLIEYQHQDRFIILSGDSLKLKVMKTCKRVLFSITSAPTRISNTLRKLFKKTPTKVHYWTHKIPEQNLNRWFYQLELADELLPLWESADREILNQLNNIFTLEEKLHKRIISSIIPLEEPPDPDELQEIERSEIKESTVLDESENTSAKFSAALPGIFDRIRDQRAIARSKVGTLELSHSRFSISRIRRRATRLNKRNQVSTRNWNNSHHVVLEDLKLNLELYRTIYTTRILMIEQELLVKKKTKSIDSQLVEIIDFHNLIKNGVAAKFSDRAEVKKYVIGKQYENKKLLKNQKIRDLSNSLINHNFPGLLDRLEVGVSAAIETLPKESEVIKMDEVDGPVEEKDIYDIAPAELILFESFPSLEKALKKGKLELLKKTGISRGAVEAISDTIEFSLDSALEILNDESKNENEAIDLVSNSMDRGIAKVTEVQEQIMEIENIFISLSEASINDFNSDLNRLAVNENIYELRFRLAKAKAIATTSDLGSKIIGKIANTAKSATRGGRGLLEKLRNKFNGISNRFLRGIKKASISTEVSNFLAESENRISSLPFLYKRLFKSEPLDDKSLFVGRESELEKLVNAFKIWDQGKYAATILLGEKGSGLTSMINHFIELMNCPYPVVRISPSSRICDDRELLKLLGSIVDSELETIEQAIELLNGQDKKRVVILEDLQSFYLKKVGGFSCLLLLQRLIAATNDKVFWVANTTFYTWEYLHKTIKLGEYFEYQINLADMNASQITEIISNRNRMSGYNILFEPPINEKNSRKFRKLSNEEIQIIYRNRYFGNLNKFSKSNINLSLLYWQLSIDEITEETIMIKPFDQPDLSFLSFLDKAKLFVLHAIVLHDRLTPAELADVMIISADDSYLSLLGLHADGMLMKRDDYFIINPLIYRQTINLLKSHNLLA